MSEEPLEPGGDNPTIGFEISSLHDCGFSDLAIRFGFGAAISIIAALVGLWFSPVVGGMFLAFPAILPATLTLIEEKDDTEAAVHNTRGAVIGGVGLVAFGLVAAALFARVSAALTLVAATAAWAGLSILIYLAVVAHQQHRQEEANDQ
jgi:hypothetical protein